MAEVDTSSYRAPQLPSLLDTAHKWGTMEQQKIQIDQAKLNLAKDRTDQLVGMLNAAGPNPTREDLERLGQHAVKLKLTTPEMYTEFVANMPSDPAKIPAYRDQIAYRALDRSQSIARQYGVPEIRDNGQQRQEFRGNQLRGPALPVGNPTQVQIPPTATVTGPNAEPQFLGPQAPQLPPGTAPARNGAPGQFEVVPTPAGPRPGLPVAQGPLPPPPVPGGVPGPLAAAVAPPSVGAWQKGGNVEGRFDAAFGGQATPVPRGPATGLPPGAAEARTQAGVKSGQSFGDDLARARNFKVEIAPVVNALKELESLPANATGPGTETFNTLKQVARTWIPGMRESEITNDTVGYQKLQKYLVEAARVAGNTGTNDQLAAAFAGNPNVKMDTASIGDVLKANLALRKMQAAQTLVFAQTRLPEEQYARWSAQNQNKMDPRAFGYAYMSPENQDKLVEQLKKSKKKFGNESEYDRFINTLRFAAQNGLDQ